MATSGSRPDQRKEKKPESVQFWLAIAAVSLAFHSLSMFGVTRLATVTVVEPAGGGAIDVEIIDPLGSKAVAEGEPIVPAAASKQESFKPEPTPLPEFSPEPTQEPTPEPSVKPEVKKKSAVKENPIVKPEVKEEKKPIVKPVKKPTVQPDKKPPTQQEQEIPIQKPGKPGEGDGDGDIRLQVAVQPNSVQLGESSKAEFAGGICKADPPKVISFPGQYPLQNGEVLVMQITWEFHTNNLSLVDKPLAPRIVSPQLTDGRQDVLKDIAVNIRDMTTMTISDLKPLAAQQNLPKSVECQMFVTVTR